MRTSGNPWEPEKTAENHKEAFNTGSHEFSMVTMQWFSMVLNGF